MLDTYTNFFFKDFIAVVLFCEFSFYSKKFLVVGRR